MVSYNTFTFGGGQPSGVYYPKNNATTNPMITQGPTLVSGGGLLPGWTMGPSGVPVQMPSATPESTVSNYGSSTTNVAGPNGPFSPLGPQLSQSATGLINAGNTALQTGMAGPGSDIYNTALQNEKNQTNVNEAQRGLTMSPYGAGVANQADINFNQTWRNNLLNNMQQGISANIAALGPGTGLYNSSYGSSTQGYNTQPPSPRGSSGGGGGGGTGGAVDPSFLPFPNLGGPSSGSNANYSLPYPPSSPSSTGPVYVPGQGWTPASPESGQTIASSIPGFPAPSDTSPVLTQQGVDWNSIVDPTAQQQLTTDQLMNQLGVYQDPNQSIYAGGPTADQLITASSDPSLYTDPTSYGSIMNANTDQSAYSLLSNWS